MGPGKEKRSRCLCPRDGGFEVGELRHLFRGGKGGGESPRKRKDRIAQHCGLESGEVRVGKGRRRKGRQHQRADEKLAHQFLMEGVENLCLDRGKGKRRNTPGVGKKKTYLRRRYRGGGPTQYLREKGGKSSCGLACFQKSECPKVVPLPEGEQV